MKKKYIVLMELYGVVAEVDCRELGYKNRKEWYNSFYLQTDHWKKVKEESRKYYRDVCYKEGCIKEGYTGHHLNYNCLWKETPEDIPWICLRHHYAAHPEHQRRKSDWYGIEFDNSKVGVESIPFTAKEAKLRLYLSNGEGGNIKELVKGIFIKQKKKEVIKFGN